MAAVSEFLADPLAFRQVCEVMGASSLPALVQSTLPGASTVALSLSPYPFSATPADHSIRSPAEFEPSIQQIKSGGTVIFLGYCGPRNGPTEDEIGTVASFIRSIPSELRNHEGSDTLVMETLGSLLYPGCGTIEGKIESYCRNMTSVELGGLLSYPLWAATAGRLSYSHDEQVALPLMAQIVERRLMKYRILCSGIKLIVGQKS
jgi:hypothetical protein